MTGRRVLPWIALAAVLVVALVIGARQGGGSHTLDGRVHRIASELRCPTCRSQSMADSDAEAAKAGVREIRSQVQAGRSDAEIRGYFVARYGDDIILKPRGRGFAALVWILPVVVFAAALTGLAVAFVRWRPSGAKATEDDRRLVQEALDG